MKFFVVAFALCLAAYASAQSQAVDSAVAAEPSVEYLPPVGDSEAAKLAEDGYRYKTVRRLRLRHRRDVSQEYLPPVDNKPSQEYLPPIENAAAAVAEETKVADDGYRYKTVRKLKFRARHRRDVSEIAAPANDYLPPVEIELAPELKTILGDDGYRYKTVRRLKYRRQRREADTVVAAEEAVAGDAAMAATSEYLPPAAIDADAAAPVVEAEPKSAELAADGYRYKTVRRIRYRHRN